MNLHACCISPTKCTSYCVHYCSKSAICVTSAAQNLTFPLPYARQALGCAAAADDVVGMALCVGRAACVLAAFQAYPAAVGVRIFGRACPRWAHAASGLWSTANAHAEAHTLLPGTGARTSAACRADLSASSVFYNNFFCWDCVKVLVFAKAQHAKRALDFMLQRSEKGTRTDQRPPL